MGEGTSKDKERSSETLNSFNNFIAHDKPSSLYLSANRAHSRSLSLLEEVNSFSIKIR
jgi:hypothetical protein